MPRILGRNSGGRSDSRLVPVAGERQPEGMSQLLPSSLLALACFFFSVNSAWGIGTLPSPPPSVVTAGVYLNPNTGRFWTMDSYEGSPSDPLSLHKYLYCRGDGVNRVDPSGHGDLVQTLSTASIQAFLFTMRVAKLYPKTAFVVLSAISATGVFDGFPPGHPTPLDELAAWGRFLRASGSATSGELAIAGRYIGALQTTFFSRASWKGYKTTFFEAFPKLRGKVWVHHAVEQQAMEKYRGAITESELNSLANLRGIPNAINDEVHLSQIRTLWDEFYESHQTATKEQLLEHAKKIDDLFGSLFDPPIR